MSGRPVDINGKEKTKKMLKQGVKKIYIASHLKKDPSQITRWCKIIKKEEEQANKETI